VVAKGRGTDRRGDHLARTGNGIFVHESPELVALLSQVDLDGEIPPQLYIAVAELLAWIYKVEREWRACRKA
jgi:flagellar biosynthesis protein